jgi:hypothetical protein
MAIDFVARALRATLRKKELQDELEKVITERREAFAYLHHVNGDSYAEISRTMVVGLEGEGLTVRQIEGMGVLHDTVRTDVTKVKEPEGGWESLAT